MSGRLQDKVAIVVGAGQTPGDTVGNGRATAILFAREGARVLAVDRRLEAAEETVQEIRKEGGEAHAHEADATREADVQAMIDACLKRYGRIDVLHNNVGIGTGDSGPEHISEEAWDRILAVNLKSVILPCKAVIPIMRDQGGGSIVNVSSIAAVCAAPMVAYKTSKAGINSYTQTLALLSAPHGIRANVIMPGLINTPMAVEGLTQALGIPKKVLIEKRDAMVPLGNKMGSAWDVAYAALFLASDEAGFITGAVLPVDGGQSARTG